MFDEETGKYNIFLELIYIIVLAASAMGDMPDVSPGISRIMKAISLAIVAVGGVMLFVSGNLSRVKKAGSFVFVYSFVLIGIIVWSIFLWIINLETIEFITRGATKFMYQFLVLAIIFSGVYLFGERTIYSTFYGLVAANTIMLLLNLRVYGISDSISSVMAMFQGAEAQEGFARAMEIHDITFTYGFFIIYFLFYAKHNRERLIDLGIAVFFFLLGWKRIAMGSLPLVIFIAVLMGRMTPRHRERFMTFVAWLLVAISFGYVVVTKVGLFDAITRALDIDTMGRSEVYNYIEKYYTISLGFIGYGFEYTTVLLQRIMIANPEAKIGVVALHNNILTVYIELGFAGFWAWVIYTWVFQLRWMLGHWGEKVAMLFFLCELYIYITYMTDNTLYYYYTSLVLRLMPMAYAFHISDEREIKYWPWVKEKKPSKILDWIYN